LTHVTAVALLSLGEYSDGTLQQVNVIGWLVSKINYYKSIGQF